MCVSSKAARHWVHGRSSAGLAPLGCVRAVPAPIGCACLRGRLPLIAGISAPSVLESDELWPPGAWGIGVLVISNKPCRELVIIPICKYKGAIV